MIFPVMKSIFSFSLVAVSMFVMDGIANAKRAEATFLFECSNGPRSLESVMKEMGAVSKTLAAQLADPTLNPDSIERTRQLETLAAESAPLCVPKLEAMTDSDARAAEYVEYQRMMTELAELSKEITATLEKNDNAASVELFTKVKALQRAAHARFRG